MIDLDTFITTLDVMGDDFCQSDYEPERPKPGRHASLSRSEVITLALFGQWVQFRKSNERFSVMHSITCERRFRSCRIAVSSIGCSEPTTMPSRPLLCFWCSCCTRNPPPLKSSTVQRP